MDNTKQNHPKIQSFSCSQEGKSNGCEFRNMSEQEQDIICRMHKLVGNKWELIAGRIPGRTAEEIERFWLMKNNSDSFKGKRIQHTRKHDNS